MVLVARSNFMSFLFQDELTTKGRHVYYVAAFSFLATCNEIKNVLKYGILTYIYYICGATS